MRGLIFADASVRAILAGKKTRTCRVREPVVRPGDRVFMAEAWRVSDAGEIVRGPVTRPVAWPAETVAVSQGRPPLLLTYRADVRGPSEGPWRSPLMLPSAYARAQLRVDAVDRAPLDACLADDAWLAAEGIVQDPDGFRYFSVAGLPPAPTAREAYLTMWRTLHGPAPLPDPAWHITFHLMNHSVRLWAPARKDTSR